MLKTRAIYYDAVNYASYDDHLCLTAYCIQYEINRLGRDMHTAASIPRRKV
jgi:hypothetical protein